MSDGAVAHECDVYGLPGQSAKLMSQFHLARQAQFVLKVHRITCCLLDTPSKYSFDIDELAADVSAASLEQTEISTTIKKISLMETNTAAR